MKSFFAIYLTLVQFLLLTSCSTTTYYYSISDINANRVKFSCNVNSYGSYNLKGKSYYIESGNNNISSNDIEFKEYAGYVSKSLKFNGAIETNDKKNADMCILITYDITDKSYIENIPIPIYAKPDISAINKSTKDPVVAGFMEGLQSRHVVGYSSQEQRVSVFHRVLNIYAYDNTKIEEVAMLWKTNISSDGQSNDLKRVITVMAYCGQFDFGRSSDKEKSYNVYEDQDNFLRWKEGIGGEDTNAIYYPFFETSNVSQRKIVIRKINKNINETIFHFSVFNEATGDNWYISPNIHIEYENRKYKVISADNIILGESIKATGETRFSLHFPLIPSHINQIDLSEKLEDYDNGWEWLGLSVKK